jgi:hypothetical protein
MTDCARDDPRDAATLSRVPFLSELKIAIGLVVSFASP